MKIVQSNPYEDDYYEPDVIVIREGGSILPALVVLGVVAVAIYGFYYIYVKSPIVQGINAATNIPNSFGNTLGFS